MTYIKTISILTLSVVCATSLVNAQDANDTKQAAFPAETATTTLTQAQKDEAGKLVDEARGIYASILNDNNDGKIEYLSTQAEFIKKRSKIIDKELAVKQAVLDGLNQKVLKRQTDIASLKSDDATKAQKRIELINEFRNEKEMLDFRIAVLKKQQLALKQSATKVGLQLANLDVVPQNKVTELEKADNQLDAIKKAEQDRRAKSYNDLRPTK